MISIKDLRRQPELYKKMLVLKNDHTDVDQILLLDKTFRRIQTDHAQEISGVVFTCS